MRLVSSLLVALALLLSPLAMIGGFGQAMAHGTPTVEMTMADHCADPSAPDDGAGAQWRMDCMSACAAVPAAAPALASGPDLLRAPAAASAPALLAGISGEGDDPPPRLS